MLSIIGAVLFGVIATMTVLVACGLPLGEFTMGGQHKILPKKFRVMAVISFAVLKCSMVFRRVSCVSCKKIEEIETVYTNDMKICVYSRREVYISGLRAFSLITSFFIVKYE